MKRRFLMLVLSALLVVSMLLAPASAYAASKKTVQIMRVTVDGARVRTGPSSAYAIETSVKKGAKVFYMGTTKNSFAYVRSEKGVAGYMYKGYLATYGTCYKDQVYYCKDKSAKVYKKANTKAKKVTTLSKNQHVVVYQVKGSWAYIKTLSGKGGYIKKSALKKAS